MTLLVTVYGHDYVTLLSDRRVSSNGIPVDDESNKAISLILEDAKLACAFTGIARSGALKIRHEFLKQICFGMRTSGKHMVRLRGIVRDGYNNDVKFVEIRHEGKKDFGLAAYDA